MTWLADPMIRPDEAMTQLDDAMIRLDDAPELAPYHDEPAQLPSAAPGKVGVLRLAFETRDGRTILADTFRQAPLLVQRALYWDAAMPDMACVFIISTAGGIVQGDRQRIDVTLAEGARVHLTTQAATKIQEMDANYASQVQQVVLVDGAYLEYLPEPTIPYRHSRFITHTRVILPESATMLYAEILMPGRKYHRGGEIFQYDLFSSTLCAARPDGTDLFVEKFLIDPGRFGVDSCGVLGGFHVLATVVLLAPAGCAARVAELTPPCWQDDPPLAAGVSRLPNDAGLIYKVLGMEAEQVRPKVRDFCATARAETVGCASPPAFSWR